MNRSDRIIAWAKRVLLRLTIGTIVLLLGVGAAVRVSGEINVGSMLQKLDITGGVSIRKDPSGRTYEQYSGKKIPRSRNDEMTFSSSQLILSSQDRDDMPMSTSSSGTLDLATLPSGNRSRIAVAAKEFLSAWETFSATTSRESYKDQLRDNGADNNMIETLAARDDSLSRPEASPGGMSGQEFMADQFDPRVHVTVIRYDGKTAYLSAAGAVRYTGPDPTLTDSIESREYALALTRFPSGWKVTRSVSQVV